MCVSRVVYRRVIHYHAARRRRDANASIIGQIESDDAGSLLDNEKVAL